MKRAFTVVALAALIGCGSGADDAPEETAAVDGEPPAMSELIADLGDVGCTLEDAEPVEGYDIFEQAECQDGSVRLYTFTSTPAQNQVVEGVTNIEGEFAVVGDLWAAEVKSRAMADKVRAALGGRIRS